MRDYLMNSLASDFTLHIPFVVSSLPLLLEDLAQILFSICSQNNN
jgi:hypothetical protein